MDNWEKERLEEQAKIIELNKKFKEVLKILLMVPKEDEGDYSDARVTGYTKTGEGITLITSKYDKWRIRIYGCYPRDKDNQYVSVWVPCVKERSDGSKYESSDELRDNQITISSNKIAKVIAKDIAQRFMPTYLKRLELVKQSIAKSDEYQAENEATLSFVVNRELTKEEKQSRKVDFYDINGHLGHIKSYGKEIELEVRDINQEQAKEILSIINKVRIKR